jgi:hypothetical protein
MQLSDAVEVPRRAASNPVLVIAALLLLGSAVPSRSQQIARFSIDAGGGRSTGGAYVVTGTFAQPDAALAMAPGHRLQGGFWGSANAPADALFANDFE